MKNTEGHKLIFTVVLLLLSGCFKRSSEPVPAGATNMKTEHLPLATSVTSSPDTPQSHAFPNADYRTKLTLVDKAPVRVAPGSNVNLRVIVKNEGHSTFPNKPDPLGRYAVSLSYRTFNLERPPVRVTEGIRFLLPGPLQPGEAVTIPMTLVFPTKPGKYVVRIDLVHEVICWFEDKKNPAIVLPVEVGK